MDISEVKALAVEQLSSVGKVYAYPTELVTPPAICVIPQDPYVEKGDTFDEFVVRLGVVLVVEAGTNEVMHEEMDSLIQQCLDALNDPTNTDRWSIGPVDRPGVETLNQSMYLTTSFEITNIAQGGN